MPAGLTTKWKDEMFRLFGLDFTIVNSQTYTDLRSERGPGENPFEVCRCTILSLPWLGGPKAERLPLREPLRGAEDRARPFFDLLILDEAHQIAPTAPKQRYAADAQQTKTIRVLAAHCTHRLFLSATPHNGYSESFTVLLQIPVPSRFARGVASARTAPRRGRCPSLSSRSGRRRQLPRRRWIALRRSSRGRGRSGL